MNCAGDCINGTAAYDDLECSFGNYSLSVSSRPYWGPWNNIRQAIFSLASGSAVDIELIFCDFYVKNTIGMALVQIHQVSILLSMQEFSGVRFISHRMANNMAGE